MGNRNSNNRLAIYSDNRLAQARSESLLCSQVHNRAVDFSGNLPRLRLARPCLVLHQRPNQPVDCSVNQRQLRLQQVCFISNRQQLVSQAQLRSDNRPQPLPVLSVSPQEVVCSEVQRVRLSAQLQQRLAPVPSAAPWVVPTARLFRSTKQREIRN